MEGNTKRGLRYLDLEGFDVPGGVSGAKVLGGVRVPRIGIGKREKTMRVSGHPGEG